MKKEVYFGLPSKVKFCKKTLISNQRPSSEIEFKHNKLVFLTAIESIQFFSFYNFTFAY